MRVRIKPMIRHLLMVSRFYITCRSSKTALNQYCNPLCFLFRLDTIFRHQYDFLCCVNFSNVNTLRLCYKNSPLFLITSSHMKIDFNGLNEKQFFAIGSNTTSLHKL